MSICPCGNHHPGELSKRRGVYIPCRLYFVHVLYRKNQLVIRFAHLLRVCPFESERIPLLPMGEIDMLRRRAVVPNEQLVNAGQKENLHHSSTHAKPLEYAEEMVRQTGA